MIWGLACFSHIPVSYDSFLDEEKPMCVLI